MASSPSPRIVSVAALEAFVLNALKAVGTSAEHAKLTADALVTADAWGVFTHGTKLLNGYLRRLKGGSIRTDVEPEILAEGPAWATVDGHSALGQVTGAFSMATTLRKAKAAGLGYAGVRNSNHFGAAGYYASLAAKAGLVGIAVCNDIPSVAAPGARKAVTGTNPIAYALPATGRDPIILDIAITTVVGGKVYAARQAGRTIPGDWLIDARGRPTSDASLYVDGGASLAPAAGHKGYGLGLLVESLSSLLTGAAMTWQVGDWMRGDASVPTGHGAAFLAIDVETIAPGGEFARRVAVLIDEVHATPAAEGVERVLLPGEREQVNQRRVATEGIPLPADVVASLELAAASAAVSLPWASGE